MPSPTRGIRLEVIGKDLSGLENEAGGHRVQRVPPTEKRGRVHTSTVTVAILSEAEVAEVDPTRFRVEWFSGTGKGGQHRNKHQNSCRVIDDETGLSEARQSRSRASNLRDATDALLARILEAQAGTANDNLGQVRKSQVGSGMRGDKTVTIRLQDDRVQHHATGKTMRAARYMRGFMDEVWT